VHPDDVDRVMKLARDHIDGRSPIYEVEHRIVAKDGSVRWFLARGKVVERVSGEARRMIGTDTDVTERKLAEQAVVEARFRLARLTRAEEMGEVAASIAHEVNQPICAIVTNARASLRSMKAGVRDNAELESSLEDIVADAKRASDVVERTRELFRRRKTSPTPLSVNDVVQDVVRLLRGTLDEQGVSVDTELTPELPAVPADSTQLRQVVFNLVLNAIEATRDNAEGARRIRIRTGRDGEDRVEIAVSDNGPGVPPGGRARLFTPFFTTKPDGMGIGLAISRTIAEAHGGDLWAADNPERGASFHLVLPAC
jgi:C4-dicarboxylate-specific signal transduction histidine kinase